METRLVARKCLQTRGARATNRDTNAGTPASREGSQRRGIPSQSKAKVTTPALIIVAHTTTVICRLIISPPMAILCRKWKNSLCQTFHVPIAAFTNPATPFWSECHPKRSPPPPQFPRWQVRTGRTPTSRSHPPVRWCRQTGRRIWRPGCGQPG